MNEEEVLYDARGVRLSRNTHDQYILSITHKSRAYAVRRLLSPDEVLEYQNQGKKAVQRLSKKFIESSSVA